MQTYEGACVQINAHQRNIRGHFFPRFFSFIVLLYECARPRIQKLKVNFPRSHSCTLYFPFLRVVERFVKNRNGGEGSDKDDDDNVDDTT